MSKPDLETKRHSLEHVMVLAVRRLYDENVLLGVGPVIENGFYQDFDRQFGEEDLPKIEAEMKKIIKEDLPFERELVEIDDLIAEYKKKKQKYKVELLEDIKKKGTTRVDEKSESEDVAKLTESGKVSVYTVGVHRDLCRGPHVKSTGELKGMAFKLDRIAGAYWRGSEKNPMLTRIYAVAFENEKDLDEHYRLIAEAKERDHKKIAQELELLMFHETSPGIPYWLPNGLAMINELMDFWREYHFMRGYQEVSSPLINKSDLYETSGHWAHYKENMFIADMGENEVYGLKPMNCPNAMIIFKNRVRSYKELPLRLSDTDQLHRYEISGTLNGLFRVRGFKQDDSHNYVTEDMIESEVADIIEITEDFYKIFGLKDSVKLYLSTRPDDFMGDIESWNKAEAGLKNVLEKSSFDFGIKEKDGAFYGPKIDIHLTDALNREWQCGTIQVDFQQPKKFELEYVAEDGSRKTPVAIHRVIYGSLERFFGIMVEHFAGSFPTWIAPTQVVILPINQDLAPEAQKLREEIVAEGIKIGKRLRVDVDDRGETLQAKIRDAAAKKSPYTIILGKRELEAGKVALRVRGKGDVGTIDREEFTEKFLTEVKNRQLGLSF